MRIWRIAIRLRYCSSTIKVMEAGDVINIMQACVILHNMIVEDEKELVRVFLDLNENASATIVLPPKVIHAFRRCLEGILEAVRLV